MTCCGATCGKGVEGRMSGAGVDVKGMTAGGGTMVGSVCGRRGEGEITGKDAAGNCVEAGGAGGASGWPSILAGGGTICCANAGVSSVRNNIENVTAFNMPALSF